MPKRKAARGRGRGRGGKSNTKDKSQEAEPSLASKKDSEDTDGGNDAQEESCISHRAGLDECSGSQQTEVKESNDEIQQVEISESQQAEVKESNDESQQAEIDGSQQLKIDECQQAEVKKSNDESQQVEIDGSQQDEVEESQQVEVKESNDESQQVEIDGSQQSEGKESDDKCHPTDKDENAAQTVPESAEESENVCEVSNEPKEASVLEKMSVSEKAKPKLVPKVDMELQCSESVEQDDAVACELEKMDTTLITNANNDDDNSESILLPQTMEADKSNEGNQTDDIENEAQKPMRANDATETTDSCEQVEEFEEVEEEVYMDKEIDDDVQYIDEEVDEDGEQDLLDVIEMGDKDNVKAGVKKEATEEETTFVHKSPTLDKESNIVQDDKDAANTTFEEISEGSMDPMEQEEVIIEAISDNEMILELSSQETEVKMEKPNNRKRNKSSSQAGEDETLADIFEVTENDDDKMSVKVHDKDNDDISDVSLCAEDEDDERNNLSLEEISDDELDSSKKRKLETCSQPTVSGDQVNEKKLEDITEIISDSDPKVDESLVEDMNTNDEDVTKHSSDGDNERDPSVQKTLSEGDENAKENNEESEKITSLVINEIEKESTPQKAIAPPQPSKESNEKPIESLSPPKPTDVSVQTENFGKKGKIVQCNISRIDGLSLKDAIKKDDPEAKMREKVSKMFNKYKGHLPSSVESVFAEVASSDASGEGVYSLSLGPVTLSDIGNEQFRDICLGSADKFNIAFNSKMQGLLKAEFSKHKEVNQVIHNLKTLDLGIRYMIVSLVHRTSKEDSSQCWQGLLILTYNQDESQMKAWNNVNDGKVRSRLNVDGVPDGISKDFVHLLFPEALYISTDLKEDTERALTLGFSSSKITKTISSSYELLLINGNKVEIASMDPIESNITEESNASGVVEEEEAIIVEDVSEEETPEDTNMELTPDANDKTSSEEIQDGTIEISHLKEKEKDTDDSNKDESNDDDNQSSKNDNREIDDIVKEKADASQGISNEDNKDSECVDEPLEEGVKMDVDEEGTKVDEVGMSVCKPMDETEKSTEVMEVEATEKESSGEHEGAETENTQQCAIEDSNKTVDSEETLPAIPSDGEAKAIPSNEGSIAQEEGEDLEGSTENNTQSSDLNQGDKVCSEKETTPESGSVKSSDLNAGNDVEESLEAISGEKVASALPETTGGNTDNENIGKEKESDKEKEVLTHDEQHCDNDEEKEHTDDDKNANLEDVSDDEIVGTDTAKAAAAAGRNAGEDDDDVVILKEEPSTKVVASIDLTLEEMDKSTNAAETDDAQEATDKLHIKKEIKIEDLVDADKLTITDGDFEVMLQSFDVDEDEMEFISEMTPEKYQYGDYRGKYYNSQLLENITNNYYRSQFGGNIAKTSANPQRQQQPQSKEVPKRMFDVAVKDWGYNRRGRGPMNPGVRPPPQGHQSMRIPYHNIVRQQPTPEFSYSRVYGRPEADIRTESHRNYEKNENHRNYEKNESHRNYEKNESHRNYEKNESHRNYAKSESHRNYEKNESHRNYEKSESHRNYEKSESHRNYEKSDNHRNYERMSSVHSGSSFDDNPNARHPVPAKEETVSRREPTKREYRRSRSPSPRRDILPDRAMDPSYHHSDVSGLTSNKPVQSSYSNNAPRSYKHYRDHRTGDSPQPPSRNPQHHQQASSSSYYDYKNTRPSDEPNPASRSRQTNSKYETTSGWRDEYHSSQHHKPSSISASLTQTRRRDKSRSFSPLSVSSSELLLRASPPAKKSRKVSNSPISASSRSLSPISKSPSPPIRYYNTTARSTSNKYKSSPPKAYRDRYSPISTRDLEIGRSGATQRRSRSRSPCKAWDRDRSRKRSRSPQFRRRSPSPFRERIYQGHDKKNVGTASSSVYRLSQTESARPGESSRHRISAQGGSSTCVNKYESHIKALYENKNSVYKKSSTLAAPSSSSFSKATAKHSANQHVKQKQGAGGGTNKNKNSYSQPTTAYGQASSSSAAALGYNNTVPPPTNTSNSSQQQQHQSVHGHSQNFPPPPQQAMAAAAAANCLQPQHPMYYQANQAMFSQYNMGGMNPAAYQAYSQQQQQQHAVMYSFIQSATNVVTNPTHTNNPYSAYTNAQQQMQQQQAIMHMRGGASNPSSSQPISSAKASSSAKPPVNFQGQSGDTPKHWSMGDGANALLFQRVLSSKK